MPKRIRHKKNEITESMKRKVQGCIPNDCTITSYGWTKDTRFSGSEYSGGTDFFFNIEILYQNKFGEKCRALISGHPGHEMAKR